MKKKRLNLFLKFILLLNILAITALTASYFAAFISPEKFWPLSFLGLAYPVLLLSNIIFIFFWLLLKRWFFALSLIAILLGYNSLLNTIGFKAKTNAVSSSGSLKLMTYNVHYFKEVGLKPDTSTRNKFMQLIGSQNPDVINIQEYYSRKKGKLNFKKALKKTLNTEFYIIDNYIDNGFEEFGMAIFSKYPIVKQGVINFGEHKSGNECIWIDIKKNNKIIRVYNVHLASIKFQPDDYHFLNEVKEDPTSPHDVKSSKKILRRLKSAFIRRGEQVAMVKKHAEACPHPYVIMGDFNDTPLSYAVKQMSAGLKNAFREKGSGFAVTYNGAFPNFQIDYILTHPAFEVMDYHIIKEVISDHYPLTAHVNLATH